MVVKSEPQPTLRGGVPRMRSFTSLRIGDRALVVAEVIRIRADPANTPPKWWLVSLYDGESTIKAFASVNTLKAGERIQAELGVVEGKPFQGKPQLTYKLRAAHPLDPANSQLASYLEKIMPREVCSKADLQPLPEGTRVKLFLRLLDPKPTAKGKFREYLPVRGDPVNGENQELALGAKRPPRIPSLVDIFQSKGRVKILQVLAEQELNISGIAERTKMNHQAVSWHLKALCRAGIVQERTFGRIRIYRLRIRS